MRAGGVVIAAAIAGCAPAATSDIDLSGFEAVILVQVATANPNDVRVVRQIDPKAPLVVGTSTAFTTALLGYPASLKRYGIEVDDEMNVVLVTGDGNPLPPPMVWIDLGAGTARAIDDVARAWQRNPFGAVQVRARRCLKLVEDRATRITVKGDTAPTMVAALDDTHALVAFEPIDNDHDTTLAVVRTGTDTFAPVSLDGFEIGAYRPRGFVERDGSIWILTPGERPAPDQPPSALQCHIERGVPLATPDCVAPTGDHNSLLFERVTGARLPDGTLEMVAISWDFNLHYWHGDAQDRGEWRRLYRGGRWEHVSCQTGAARVAVVLDGPGRGVASFETGPLERFAITTSSVTHEVIFAPPGGIDTSCRTAFGKHPLGQEVFVRVDTLYDATLPPPVVTWWRPDAMSAWRMLGAPNAFEPDAVFPLDDALLVSGQSGTVTPLVFDPLRPDARPRVCPQTSVLNSASLMVPVTGGGVLIAGDSTTIIEMGTRTLSRWRLEDL